MNNRDVQEHIAKEALKRIVDNGPNYTEEMKQDLKSIIDVGKSANEILQEMLTYFAVRRFF